VRIDLQIPRSLKRKGNIDKHKATLEIQTPARRGRSPPEAESIWPQFSDNPKYGKQTVTTAITTTTQFYVEIVTVMLVLKTTEDILI